MIRFSNVSKDYPTRFGPRRILSDLDFEIPSRAALALIGRNGAGKSTLMRLIAGVEQPSQGQVHRAMSVSWPIGFSSAFQSSLTGADNARFVARIYQQPVDRVLAQVEAFAELGGYFRMPVRTYSAGMLARLAFALSLAIDFDCYLVDEVTAAGDQRFRERCHEALIARRDSGALIMTSHDPTTLLAYCATSAVLIDGRLKFFDSVEEGLAAHAEDMAVPI
jgi:capsular polysaccharide transport system ATP-binding protein